MSIQVRFLINKLVALFLVSCAHQSDVSVRLGNDNII